MPRRSVYVPDPPPQRKNRSSFVRSAPPSPQPPTQPSENTRPTTAPGIAVVEVLPQMDAPAEHLADHKHRRCITEQPTEPTNGQRSPDSLGAPETSAEKPVATPARREVPRWILQVRDLDLVEIAEVLGLEFQGDRLLPCPRCADEDGAEVYRNKKGWTLWRCRACSTRDRGNLDLAAYALAGEKAGDLEPEPKALLQQWFADQGWCDPVDTVDNGGVI